MLFIYLFTLSASSSHSVNLHEYQAQHGPCAKVRKETKSAALKGRGGSTATGKRRGLLLLKRDCTIYFAPGTYTSMGSDRPANDSNRNRNEHRRKEIASRKHGPCFGTTSHSRSSLPDLHMQRKRMPAPPKSGALDTAGMRLTLTRDDRGVGLSTRPAANRSRLGLPISAGRSREGLIRSLSPGTTGGYLSCFGLFSQNQSHYPDRTERKPLDEDASLKGRMPSRGCPRSSLIGSQCVTPFTEHTMHSPHSSLTCGSLRSPCGCRRGSQTPSGFWRFPSWAGAWLPTFASPWQAWESQESGRALAGRYDQAARKVRAHQERPQGCFQAKISSIATAAEGCKP